MPSLAATYVIQPTARILLILALFLATDRVSAAVIGTCLSYILGWIYLAWTGSRDFPARGMWSRDYASRARSVLAYAPVLGVSTLAFTVARSLDTISLAHFAPVADVGRYAVVLMVGQLVAVIGASLGQTLGTRVAAAAHAGDHARTAAILRDNMTSASMLCAPFCIAIALWGHDVDLVLGPSYHIPTEVFAVACVTQWMMTTTHYSSVALSLTGRQMTELVNNLIALAVQAVACLLLVPSWGMLGAAASTMLSILGINLLRQGQIARMLGAPVFSLRLLTPLLLSLLVAAPLYLLDHWLAMRAWWLTGLLAGGQVVLSFLVIWLVLANDSQRQMLDKILRRGGKNQPESATLAET
jgi:O-antigen/teichoic acid export membrane protein